MIDSTAMTHPSRRDLVRIVTTPALAALLTGADEKDPTLDREALFHAPPKPEDWAAWRSGLQQWRDEARRKLSYSDALYRREDFAWVPSSLSCCFLMLCDETFYDWRRGRYETDRFLDAAVREFGGYDSLVLWHAYPRIGLDDRNQFDFYRDMPGGLAGLRNVAAACHARGVRVFLNYNPWDRRTRREPVGDLEALAALVKATDADGIFLDTMNRGASEFRALLDAAKPGVVLESEIALPLANVHDHHMSWAQWFKDSHAPGVLRNKWFERRHVMHQIDRFSRDHSGELHTAWMNGTGMMVWENVFGSWVGWNERDKSVYRSMLPVQRRFTKLFSGEGWTPLVAGVQQPGVYASLWEAEGVRVWTLVNRSETAIEGPLLQIERRDGERVFDLIAGAEVEPGTGGTLPVNLWPRGVGAYAAARPQALGNDFASFLAGQRRLHHTARLSPEFPAARTVLKPVVRRARRALPPGMIAIPAARLLMRTQFRIRETGFYESTHPHFGGAGPHKLHVPIWFERSVDLTPFAIDATPVTNGEFARFLKSSGYRPRHAHNFLRHWNDGKPPAGLEQHPVVWVDFQDARAYASWAGKRLPAEDEWQYAAQGGDGRTWPWGNEFDASRCNGGAAGSTTPVTAFPDGRSPFGVYDMCGNTWEWTESERSDGRTRFCILRGGSWYDPKGSEWYMDGGPRPADFAAKFLMMWSGLDRCGTVGFRCAVDLG